MSEPLVLVPGMMCDARVWATQMTVMSYERAVTITDVEQLAGAMTEQLAALFDTAPRAAKRAHQMGLKRAG